MVDPRLAPGRMSAIDAGALEDQDLITGLAEITNVETCWRV